jgi:putative transposase
VQQKFKKTPPRLKEVFQRYNPPLYLVTVCTFLRQRILACPEIHLAFRVYAADGQKRGIAVGRYVIMPDHLHAFLRTGGEVTLSRWVKGMKRHLGSYLESLGHQPATIPEGRLRSFWQPGSFDHLLRHSESYAQKWEYVWQNPVRAGLVDRPEAWPYQGEIVLIDQV